MRPMNLSNELRCECCGWSGNVTVQFNNGAYKLMCADSATCKEQQEMNDALEAEMAVMEAQTAYENGNAFWA